MSYNIKYFSHKTCHENNNFHRFDLGTSFEEVLEWCIDNNCKGFSRDPDGYYHAKHPDILSQSLLNSVNYSRIFFNNFHMYIITE